MTFDEAFDMLLGHEGGYSNNRHDPGGETMWGITHRVALQEGYSGDMHIMPREFAKQVYKKRYWDAAHIPEMPIGAEYAVFDAAVNSGVSQAIQWVQRVAGVVDDGKFGPVTKNALDQVAGYMLAVEVTALRLDFMTSLPTWGQFGRGWARRIAAVLQAALK